MDSLAWHRSRTQFLCVAGAAATSAGLSALLAYTPSRLLPHLSVAVLLMPLALAVVLRPVWALHALVLSSALAGLVRGLGSSDLGATTMSASGLRWLLVSALLLLGAATQLRRPTIPRWLIPFFVFGLWAALRWAAAGADLRGAKDVLFYNLAPLAGLFAHQVLSHGGWASMRRVDWVILHSAFVPLAMYLLLIPAGLVDLTPNGPRGAVGPRPVATYLLVPLSVALADWAYGESARRQARGRLISLLSLGVIAFTLSRMAIATALLLIGVSRFKPFKASGVMAAGLTVVALNVSILAAVPALKDRYFHRPPDSVEDALRLFKLSGRDRLWPSVFARSVERPIAGWGPGAARPIAASILFDDQDREYPVHNEYLTALHDLGVIGLILMCFSWFSILFARWKGWSRAHASGQLLLSRYEMAASLCALSVTVNALVDNTFHYSTVTVPVFIVFAQVFVARSTLAKRFDSGAGKGAALSSG